MNQYWTAFTNYVNIDRLSLRQSYTFFSFKSNESEDN